MTKTNYGVLDFDRGYRFRMVKAYPIISGVTDPYSASLMEIDAGFARCLTNAALRRTHDIYIDELERMSSQLPEEES